MKKPLPLNFSLRKAVNINDLDTFTATVRNFHNQNEKYMWSELKAFLLRGDVVTLAVAFIIGGAFNAIVTSFVADIITPVIGLIFGEPDFSGIAFFYEKLDEQGKPVGGIQVGKFINNVISFLIVGITLFFVIKAAGKKTEEVK